MNDKVIVKKCTRHGELTADQCRGIKELRCRECELRWERQRRARCKDLLNEQARIRRVNQKEKLNIQERTRYAAKKAAGILPIRKKTKSELAAQERAMMQKQAKLKITSVTNTIKRLVRAKQIHQTMTKKTSIDHENDSGN